MRELNELRMEPLSLSSIVWLASALAVLGGVALAARKIEFNSEFRARLYKLSPGMLRDPAYAAALDGIIDWRSVKNARRWYTASSVFFVAASAIVTACTPFKVIAQSLLPPLLFGALEPAGSDRSCSLLLFLWSSFFAVAFHFAPLVGAYVSRTRPVPSVTATVRGNPVLEVITRLFAFQEYILQRYIDDLLQYKASIKGEVGSIADQVRQEIAMAMDNDHVDASHSYALLLDGNVRPIATRRDPTNLEKIMVLINAYGIPFVRKALKWRTSRKSQRFIVAREITVEMCSQRHDAFMVNIGIPNELADPNSFLLRVPDESAALLNAWRKTRAEALRVIAVNGQPLNGEAFRCRVTRVNPSDETLYIGAVIQDQDVKRFAKYFRFQHHTGQ